MIKVSSTEFLRSFSKSFSQSSSKRLFQSATQMNRNEQRGTIRRVKKTFVDSETIYESSDKKETQKVIAALARRGYGFSDIRSALAEFDTEAEIFED